ncbi:ATP synthase F1 subunit delta [Maribacter hydrothermalis]|uniref:ATP synthase subunit delta n=1 Tax=Maribacter hydrothermalis TaxID=1836467 RepID=A0A1B7ZEB0_9FLAO|nr:ATP synthase F1 subunit delta [Maribacter hydrothermalis]APQ17393.1 ATP synthase F1 subunit delta [Maribacter hydrothermalis]OBR41871.1 ATP synthase F1 subunit delta [Maribacter hydrothermalis]
MSESRAALRYAKAILDMAKENKALDAVEKDMRSIATTVSDSKELRDVLANPVVSGSLKKNALLEIFKGSHSITEGTINMLVDNKRLGMLNEVALKYIILNEQLKGKDVAYVTTAVPLDAAMEKKVLKQVATITGNEVTIENKIDESIIGGFILRVGDLQYDASIANKLSNIKREFSNSL